MGQMFLLFGRQTTWQEGSLLIEGEKDLSHSSDRSHILG
jgi:hypothetical protein